MSLSLYMSARLSVCSLLPESLSVNMFDSLFYFPLSLSLSLSLLLFIISLSNSIYLSYHLSSRVPITYVITTFWHLSCFVCIYVNTYVLSILSGQCRHNVVFLSVIYLFLSIYCLFIILQNTLLYIHIHVFVCLSVFLSVWLMKSKKSLCVCLCVRRYTQTFVSLSKYFSIRNINKKISYHSCVCIYVYV